MTDDRFDATVDVWVRSRWDAEPWLEERMAYTAEQNTAFFRDVICDRCEIWIAVKDDETLGLIAIADREVDQLHIAPEHQRKGIGSALMAKAKQLHPDELRLYTHQRNERARRFYEKQGFVAVEFGISPEPECEPDVRFEWTG